MVGVHHRIPNAGRSSAARQTEPSGPPLGKDQLDFVSPVSRLTFPPYMHIEISEGANSSNSSSSLTVYDILAGEEKRKKNLATKRREQNSYSRCLSK